MKAIGITGYKRSGKDSLANILVGVVDSPNVFRVGFADSLKQVLYDMNPDISTEHGHVPLRIAIVAWGWEGAKDRYPQVRQYLQRLGVAARERVIHNVWLQAFDRAVSGYADDALVIVPDVRFVNEAEWLRSKYDARIVRIERPGTGIGDLHVSETEHLEIAPDVVFQNDGTLRQLELQVRNWNWMMK